MKYPIKEEWEHYYKALELIRESGITNMWMAVFADVGVAFIAIINALRAMKI